MLEKTAATLEPCGLQRVFPRSKKSLGVSRQLHTSFWQHGAASIELTNAWQALMHGTVPFNDDSNPEPEKNPGLRASAFLLDFLYPTGAIALMRRLALSVPERSENFRYATPFSKITPRLYTSSTPRQQTRGSKSGSESKSVAHHEQQPKSQDTTSHEGAGPTSVQRDEPAQPLTSEPSADDGIPAPGLETNEPPTQDDTAVDGMHAYDHERALTNLLVESKDPEDADRVWYHYRALNEQSQAAYLNSLLLFLSKTGRLSDSWKISELFHKLDVSNWSEFSFIAGVTAEVNLQNLDQALGIFIKGLSHETLDTSSLVDALDLLLATALRSPTTDFLRSLWKHYPEMAAKLDFEKIMSQLVRLSLVPDLADKAIAFREYMIEDPESTVRAPEAFETLQKILVRRALVRCADDQVIPVLRVTNDPMAFEQVLKWAVSRSRRKLGTEIYQIYRELPGCTPSRNVLYEMFRAYKSMNVPMYAKIAGFELLWGDWYKFHGGPSRRAYQKYLAFYASRGNKEQVYMLWTQYIALPQEEEEKAKYPILFGDDTFAHLLQVHAVLGEADETQRVFDEISARFGLEPSSYLWNILLNAYAKAGDYDGAIDTFDKMDEVGKADQYSYGTLMQMAGRRGDLGFTVDLYRRALRRQILANDAILSSLVDAYCQNAHFTEAQDVCVRSAQKGIVATRMWNKLLYYHALRRDLGSLNKLLNIMAEMDIPYNEFTYQQLLLGLSLSRQSQHALRLLAVAIQDQVFKVTPEHFYIVMGALLRTGEPGPVKRLHKLMKEYGFPSSSNTLFRFAHAIGQWTKLPPNQRYRKTATEWFGESLRAFYQIYGLNGQTGFRFDPSPPLSPPRRSGPSDLLKFGPEQYQFGAMVYMFTQFKDLVRSRELIDLYRYVFQDHQDTEGILPVVMLNSVMAADLFDKRYDRVRATWQLLFKTAKVEARSKDYNEDLPHTPKISPAYQYILSGGLKVMQEAYFEEENSSGLKDLFRSVLDAGFLIDSKNWNYYIQALVQLKQYKEAFVACETMLMPNWTGWFVVRTKENVRNRLPIDVRRMGSSPRYLRPISATLYRLAQGYMELDRLGPWSREAARLTREIDEECIQVVRAIKSLIRVHSNLETQIFGPAQSMDNIEIGPVDRNARKEMWQETI
ncbi:hypothetical protein F4809DRAFT_127502 [Biscogniauxia mediterranea]|nr:hypothetical protein F4809DRAFT_127502 [Biscogniauxia mediterranea]